MAINNALLLPKIREAIHDNPDIAEKGMRGQFDKLILKPLQKLDTLKQDDRSNVSPYINVIVIDALDECEGDSDIRLILQLLPQIHDSDTATYPRVLLTSRPDLPIRLGFSKLVRQNYKDFSLHDIPLEVIEKDISLFFNHRFEEIITDRFLPTQWPGESDFDRLVALSVPLFISLRPFVVYSRGHMIARCASGIWLRIQSQMFGVRKIFTIFRLSPAAVSTSSLVGDSRKLKCHFQNLRIQTFPLTTGNG